ncbi:phosphonoacetate hydrolase [Lecanosticta acicola]|uniref:Phosphonoacetate hydrolase n=1 Tax=Lecanosticta acicola TaxID=111012 RepID=A0AAI9ECB7_9PEZI|nr:phosphonoacetate hydrolase [Lecanosticta acicola]
MVAATLSSVEVHARETVPVLFDFITKQRNGDYLGEAVSQLQHFLQAATLAQKADADNETVEGTLLHDVGRFIPDADEMPPMIAHDGTLVAKASHKVLGEISLRQSGVNEHICQLVGSRVTAKRYLTAVDNSYLL